VRRPSLVLKLTAAALAGLSLLSPAAANAAPLFDAGTSATSTDLTVATVTAPSKLPQWLQTVVSKANLYANDGTSTQSITQLSRNTFLRVIASGTNRIQVQAYDDNGNPAQTGWIEAEQVMPSAPGINWLVTSIPTTLFSDADSNTGTRNLDRFAPLQELDSSIITGRALVQVYKADFSGIVDQGWIDVSATGPALPPQFRVPSLDGTLKGSASTLQTQDFLNQAAQAARSAAALTGVPASVTVAQAILESDWGRSALAQDANNYFGMKAMGTLGDAGVVWMPTSEYDSSGSLYQTVSAFRAYNSLTDSMADHDHLLMSLSRYASAMQVRSDPRQFAEEIMADGYSTDPAYADKLIALMDRYNLYQLDS